MAKKKPITVDELWQIERLGAPSLAPDGATAVAAVTRYAMADDTSQSSLWLMSTRADARGSARATRPRQLTQCGSKDGQPRWSPRGDRIAFIAKREQEGSKDTEPQLYLIAPDGGEAQRAADIATGVDGFRWCPDGKRLVFISWVWPELKGAKAQAAKHAEFKARKETGYVTSEAQYRWWDRNLPMGRVAHLHVLELGNHGEAGKPRDLFEGSRFELSRADPNANHFDISPDSKRLVFAFDPAPVKRPDGRLALAEMEIKSGRISILAQDADWDFGTPSYSPDGDRIAFLASHVGLKHTMPSQLAVWDRASAEHEVVSAEWDHELQAPLRWEEDGQALLFTAEQKGRTHLWRFDLADRRAEVVVSGGWVTQFDKAAGTLVTLADSAMHPAQLCAHAPGEPPLRIERFNDALLDTLALGRVEEVWFKGAHAAGPALAMASVGDGASVIASAASASAAAGEETLLIAAEGDDVQMWLVYPPDFDPRKKYPLLHNIHGGPHTTAGDNWHYRWNTQTFAAQGYVVASVNYHGSSSFGYAFLDSITHRWGALELQDVEAATTALLAKPWVDPQRVFATGGSYGGYMVAWMNGHVPVGRYAAYVCHAGCFDWVGMFADDAWSWHARNWAPGTGTTSPASTRRARMPLPPR